MSLSNNERTSYIYHAIDNMVRLAKELHDFDDIKNEVNKLWPATLGNSSNGAHWILGSSGTNQLSMDSFSPFHVALIDGFEEDNKLQNEEERKKDPNYKSFDERMNEHYDPLYEALTIKNLIYQYHYLGQECSIVYEIFCWTEQLIYALRRYRDEYFKRYEKLSDVISSIQGYCFPVFRRDIFRKAYLAHEIFTIIYQNREIEDILKKQYIHHDLYKICEDYQISDIIRFHKKIIGDKSTANCIYLIFEIAGRHYHYNHKYKELVNELKQKKIKIDYKKLDNLFKESCKKRDEHEKEQHEKYSEEKDGEHYYCVHHTFLADEKDKKGKLE